MALFNTTQARPAVSSPIVTTAAHAVGAGGQPGYSRTSQSELYLLGVTLLNVGKDTFYERGDARTDRFKTLVRELAVTDPGWVVRFLCWLRAEGNLRSAPIVGAAEFAAARRGIDDPNHYICDVVDGVQQRADEPGELLAYWTSHYGMTLPKGVKKGTARAVQRLYNEYSLTKYDRPGAAFRFARILDLVHPRPVDAAQSELFNYAHGDMRGRATEPGVNLPLLRARAELLALPVQERRPAILGPGGTDRLRTAGMTWEAVAGWLQGPLDAQVWTALIPTMGYTALLRNLRNFDDTGVSDEVAAQVAARLADPEKVAKSRMLPFRFYAAYTSVQSLRWGHTLEKALAAALSNIPALPGRTLVVVDQSPSMLPGQSFSSPQQHETITNADLAKLFGTALALRCHAGATLAGYGQESYQVPLKPGDSLLRVMAERFRIVDGTDTFGAIANHFARHDRVVVVTDEQNTASSYLSVDQVVPKDVPVYVWNIGGYQVGSTASGRNRHTFGGLTDAGFRAIQLLERGRNADWPF